MKAVDTLYPLKKSAIRLFLKKILLAYFVLAYLKTKRSVFS